MHNPIDRLRALPSEMAPPYNWQEFQRRSQEPLHDSRASPGWRPLAAAAALLLMVCGVAVWGRWGRGVHDPATVGMVPPPVVMRIGPAAEMQTGSNEDAAFAAVRSRAIESWLATLPREPGVVRVGTRAAAASLEDRIAQVDDLMTSVRVNGVHPDRLAALQTERFKLVGSLAQVRYAEVVAGELP